jgi:hypothetical protein
VSEALASRLKQFCRLSLVAGSAILLWFYWLARTAKSRGDIPFSPEAGLWLLTLVTVVLAVAMLLSSYLMVFLGVDVLGLNHLLRMPAGKPFTGLQPDEQERLRLNCTRGSIGWANFNGLFKLLLTNRRLLVGANLTSWYLLEVPLPAILSAEVRRRFLFFNTIRLTTAGLQGTEAWEIGLQKKGEFERLAASLRALGVPFTTPPGR